MRNQKTNTTTVGLRLISFTMIHAPYTLATWCKELTHLKRPWCWERLRTGGEGDDGGWDGRMASSTPCTWVWVDSGSWWWTGRPGVLWFMGSQRVRHDWAMEVKLMHHGLPGGASDKEPTCQKKKKKEPTCQCRCQRHRFDAWLRKIPWRRAWQPTPVFLSG